jgi:hypothetical protein
MAPIPFDSPDDVLQEHVKITDDSQHLPTFISLPASFNMIWKTRVEREATDVHIRINALWTHPLIL